MKICISLGIALALSALASAPSLAEPFTDADNLFTPPSDVPSSDGGSTGRLARPFGGDEQFGVQPGGGQFGGQVGRGQFGGGGAAGQFGGQRHGRGSKERIPNLKQLRSLPSLTPQQRKQIVQIMRQAKADAGPLLEQAKEIGLQIRDKNNANGGAGLAGNPGSSGFQPASEQEAGSVPARTGRKQKLGSLAELRASGALRNLDPQTRAKLREIRQQIQAKRQQTWSQVKQILTAQQIQELESMRSGQLMPASLRGVNQ